MAAAAALRNIDRRVSRVFCRLFIAYPFESTSVFWRADARNSAGERRSAATARPLDSVRQRSHHETLDLHITVVALNDERPRLSLVRIVGDGGQPDRKST